MADTSIDVMLRGEKIKFEFNDYGDFAALRILGTFTLFSNREDILEFAEKLTKAAEGF